MKRILLLLLLIAHTAAFSQLPFFQQYDLLHKRQGANISCLYQDPSGLIWVGASNGLFRLDGRSVAQHPMPDSLKNLQVTAMVADSLNRLWLGFSDGSIRYIDNGTCYNFLPEEGNSTEPISSLLFDKKGRLWFSTLNDGLYYYRDSRLFRLDEQEGFPDLYVYHITESSEGRIVASTDRGLAICTLTDGKVDVKVIDTKSGLPDNIVKKTLEFEGKLWVATEDKGLFLYDGNTFQGVAAEWPYGSIYDFVIKGSELWLATANAGVVVYNTSDKSFRAFDDNAHEGLSICRFLMTDVEGNVWCGSRKNLLRTPGTGLQFYSLAGMDNVLAVTVDHKSNIWYSTESGLFRRSTNGDVKPFPIASVLPSKSKTNVISLFTDINGDVWAGLYGEGVVKIDPVSAATKRIFSELRNGNILNITGNDKAIWLATLGGATRITINGPDQKSEHFHSSNGLSSDFIYQILLDRKGRVWFATDGDGVDMYDGSSFHNYKNGLPSSVIYGLAEDGNGKIWANVQGNGVFVFDEKGAFVNPFPGQLRHHDIFAIGADKQGNLILAHEFGLDILDAKRNKLKFLGEESGLDGRLVNLNAIGRDKEANLFFGTSNGIVRFAEGNEFLDHSPLVRIGEVKVFDSVYTQTQLKQLSYDENNITINMIGLWFRSPDDIEYHYQLENYDRDWIRSSNSSVTYSRLPPGDYTFRVKVAEKGTLPQTEETILRISVSPPFWKTVWFYLLSAALILMLSYAIIHYRERKLLHDKFILEARVKRRTLEIQRQNDEIQAQNEEIMAQAEEIKGINENLEMLVKERTSELERKNKALEEYAFINAHKLRSPVASILGLVNLISRTHLDGDGKEISKRLQQSADELDEIVRSITKAIEKGDKQYSSKDHSDK